MIIGRRFTAALAALFFALGSAHAQTGSPKSPAILNTETNSLWPDNIIGAITPFNARQTLLDIIASYSAYVPIIVVTTPVTLATLQSAINTACSAGNAIVQIPTGSWTIDTTSAAITISSCPSIIIQGSGGITSGGPNGTLLNNSAAANDLFTVTTNGSVVFQDLAINASVTKSAGTALIRLNNSTTGLSQQVIQRLSINNGCNAIQVDNSFQFIIEDNLITSSTCAGVVITQPTLADQGNNVVARNKIWDVNGTAGADSCILWHRGSGVRIEGNRCLGAFNYGLHVQFDNTFGNDGALIAIGNTFELQKLSGIYLERTAGALAAGKTIGQMVFSNNFIQTITSGGTGSINIAVSGGSAWVQGCVITSNSMQINITQAFNAGIEIDGADQCNVADNMLYVTGGAAAGIRVSGNSTNTKVVNNSNDGTTAATKYPALTATTTLIDMAGMAVANLPATVGNGSMVYATDGSPTNPITGNGSGAVAMRVNGAWVAAGVVKPMTQQRLTTGTNATYTAPTAPAPSFIKTTCWGAGGGGGGGAGTSTGGGTGGTGGATCFGTNATACTTPTVSAPGGIGGIGGGNGGSLANAAAGGAGGAAGSAIGDGAFSGFPGTGSPPAPSNVAGSAGTGGGQGAGKGGAISTIGGTGLAPGGGGGGGGGASTVAIAAGAGGGSGGQAWAIIAAPAATYTYTVGAAGSAGAAGTGGATPAAGGAGGPGYCTVDEGYQ